MKITIQWLAITVLMLLATGCGSPPGEIFPPLAKPLVWPTTQATPRIRYVGQLATSADLKPAVPAFQQLGDAIFGKSPSHSMLTPYAVCTDNADRVFVADSNAQVVHVFNLNNRKYAQWKPEKTSFSQPVGIAFDSIHGYLFVSDSVARSIFVFDTYGKVVRVITSDLIQRPTGLAFDQRTDRLFVADVAGHQIVVLSGSGVPITKIGSRGSGPGQFNFPTNVAMDSTGVLYVSDSLNFRVQQFDADLKFARQIGQGGDMPGYFAQPKGLAIDTENHLYVVDAHFEAVQIFDAAGHILLDFGTEGHGAAQFWLPSGIFIDNHNRIYVADGYNRRIQVFDYLPEVHQ